MLSLFQIQLFSRSTLTFSYRRYRLCGSDLLNLAFSRLLWLCWKRPPFWKVEKTLRTTQPRSKGLEDERTWERGWGPGRPLETRSSVEVAQKIRDEGVFGFLRKIDKPKMEEANGKTATVKKRVKSKKKGKHRNSGKNENFKAWKLMPNQNLGENLRVTSATSYEIWAQIFSPCEISCQFDDTSLT